MNKKMEEDAIIRQVVKLYMNKMEEDAIIRYVVYVDERCNSQIGCKLQFQVIFYDELFKSYLDFSFVTEKFVL